MAAVSNHLCFSFLNLSDRSSGHECDKNVTRAISGNRIESSSYRLSHASSDTAPPPAVDFWITDRARRLFEEVFPAEILPATWSHGNRTFAIHDYLGFTGYWKSPPLDDTQGAQERARIFGEAVRL